MTAAQLRCAAVGANGENAWLRFQVENAYN